MAEIEDLQVELESIICVQKLERLIDLAKYFNPILDFWTGGGQICPPAGFLNIAQKPLGLGS